MTISIGIDIGQRRDPTAVCVAETDSRPTPNAPENHFLVRYLNRLPLGSPYPEIARRLAEVSSRVADRASARPTVYVDATGVGLPVIDILKSALPQAHVVPVFFTHGDRRTRQGGEVRMGKAFLVSSLQALLQTGRIHLPRTPEATALAKELGEYEIRVSKDANDRYGAFKVGTHDDLVTALGLAVCQLPRRELKLY
jgi:Terminase RNaseH-like domain